jgi:hypothetical protein
MEDISETPSMEALKPWHPHFFDTLKRRLGSAHILRRGRSNDQSDVMDFGERRSM